MTDVEHSEDNAVPGDQGWSAGGDGFVEDLYKDWFLDYASYVILDRAVPCIDDGLKPVQRRILHAMWEIEDGRFNKVANIIGHTMRYHPHGDAAIGDALTKLGQRDLLVETQGNWGNQLTGDRAAAPRYIEARLSQFAKDVLFNPKTTNWVRSYDGRNKEPINLPAKFPLLLVHGAEGIAVGLSTRILPHNFCEVIKAAISHLKGRKQKIYPDFFTGGLADFSQYNDGAKGGRVRVRAKIVKQDAKTLCVKELPFGTSTGSLIDSILAANDKGKVKIKRVEDNTAAEVDIQIEVPAGVSLDLTIDGLYAFTDCEISIATNCCIIRDDRPHFVGVSEVLETSVQQTSALLQSELEIRRHELREKIHLASLEQVFIENKIYRKIENCETWEDVLKTIAAGLKPFASGFIRAVTDDDLVKLTEIKIKRISKFDSSKAEEALAKLRDQVAEVEYDLKNLTDYVIRYYENLLEKYGKERKRRTVKESFDEIKAVQVAVSDQKLFVDAKEGFVGTGIKKGELVAQCTEFDEVIGFGRDGSFKVAKIAKKVFYAKDLLHVDVFKRNDERRVYHMIYRDGPRGATYVKRFSMGGVTRDKIYDLTRGTKGSKVLYFSANPNGEAEVVEVRTKAKTGRAKKPLVIDFGDLEIKARSVKGNLVTKESVEKVCLVEKGESTLEAQKLYFDRKGGRLVAEETSEYLGEFVGDELLFVLNTDGTCELNPVDLNHYFGTGVQQIMRFVPGLVISVVFYEGERKAYYGKRFAVDESFIGKRNEFVPPTPGTTVIVASASPSPLVKVTFKPDKGKTPTPELVRLADFIDVKGVKALGNKLSRNKVKDVKLL